jgi:hypothetical protein
MNRPILLKVLGIVVLMMGTSIATSFAVRARPKDDPGWQLEVRKPGSSGAPGPQASTKVDGGHVTVTASEDGRQAQILFGDGSSRTLIDVAKGAGRITELQICTWVHSGVAVVAEVTSEERKERSYYWATCWANPWRGMISNVAGAEFLRTSDDHDLGSLINSESDTIYMVLSRHRRFDFGQTVEGYVFIHNCPIGHSKGSVIRFDATQKW